MRWIKPKYESEDIKIKRKFAVMPITIGNETRWLEWVTVKYEFCLDRLTRDNIYAETYVRSGWYPIEFVDKN